MSSEVCHYLNMNKKESCRGKTFMNTLNRKQNELFKVNVWAQVPGGHLIASSATTQNVVATSSGEAEFYALTKSAWRALGAVAMAA